jgi:hypothetical protein
VDEIEQIEQAALRLRASARKWLSRLAALTFVAQVLVLWFGSPERLGTAVVVLALSLPLPVVAYFLLQEEGRPHLRPLDPDADQEHCPQHVCEHEEKRVHSPTNA